MTAVAKGGGTTLTFATTGATTTITARYRSIEGHTEEIPEVDDSDLSTTGYSEVVSGDLVDPGSFTYIAIFDPTIATMPTPGTAETVTITRPDSSTMSGTAFIKSIQHPGYAQNEPQLATVTVRWDGKTGPAHAT